MGWINEFEQQNVLSLYGKLSQHRCNKCRRLIWIDELEVIDPKGGYFKVPEGTYGNRYNRPKVCYCRECDFENRGKRIPDVSTTAASADGASIQEWILKTLARSNEFNTRKLIRLYPGKVDKKTIRAAVKVLKKSKQIKRVGQYLVLQTSTKEKRKKKKKKH